MKNSDMPAMPLVDEDGVMSVSEAFVWTEKNACIGLTKREYFAGLAMQGCRARPSNYPNWVCLARDAVEMADALLAELERSK